MNDSQRSKEASRLMEIEFTFETLKGKSDTDPSFPNWKRNGSRYKSLYSWPIWIIMEKLLLESASSPLSPQPFSWLPIEIFLQESIQQLSFLAILQSFYLRTVLAVPMVVQHAPQANAVAYTDGFLLS